MPLQFGDRRPGDQPVFVSGPEKAIRKLEWQATIPLREGVGQLVGLFEPFN